MAGIINTMDDLNIFTQRLLGTIKRQYKSIYLAPTHSCYQGMNSNQFVPLLNIIIAFCISKMLSHRKELDTVINTFLEVYE